MLVHHAFFSDSTMLDKNVTDFFSGMNATGDPAFSMFNLSLLEDWMNNRKFCHRLSDDEEEEENHKIAIREATHRLTANMSTPMSSNATTPNGAGSKSPVLERSSNGIQKTAKFIFVQ